MFFLTWRVHNYYLSTFLKGKHRGFLLYPNQILPNKTRFLQKTASKNINIWLSNR